MSQKKKQTPAKKISQPLNPQNGKKSLKSGVRTTILADLVALSIVQLLANNEIITEGVGMVLTMVGLVVLVAALGVQFRGESR